MHEGSIHSALVSGKDAALKELDRNPNDNRAIWARLPPVAIEPLVAALRAQPEIAELEGKYCYTAQGATELDFGRVAGFLIERSLYVDPRIVSEDLIRLVADRTYTWVEVHFLEYCQLSHRIDFEDGFSAIPLLALPKEYAPTNLEAALLMNIGSLKPEQMTPIVRQRELKLRISKTPPSEDEPLPPDATPGSDWDAVLNAIIIAGKGAPKWGLKYQFIKDPGWIWMTRIGSGRGDNHFGPVDVVKSVDASIAKDVFKPLRKASPGLLLALRMLAKARRRKFEATEKVIDLGTCAEVLLMNKSSDNNEISMKVGLRSAWFLNGGAVQRIKTFKTFRALYGLRSIAVHTGEMPKAKGVDKYREQQECIREADALLVRLLIKMLTEGMPADGDWSNIVLDAT